MAKSSFVVGNAFDIDRRRDSLADTGSERGLSMDPVASPFVLKCRTYPATNVGSCYTYTRVFYFDSLSRVFSHHWAIVFRVLDMIRTIRRIPLAELSDSWLYGELTSMRARLKTVLHIC